MAMNLNVVALTGRLTDEPACFVDDDGTDVTTLRVAVARLKRRGQQRAEVDVVDVVTVGEEAKLAARYLSEGVRDALVTWGLGAASGRGR